MLVASSPPQLAALNVTDTANPFIVGSSVSLPAGTDLGKGGLDFYLEYLLIPQSAGHIGMASFSIQPASFSLLTTSSLSLTGSSLFDHVNFTLANAVISDIAIDQAAEIAYAVIDGEGVLVLSVAGMSIGIPPSFIHFEALEDVRQVEISPTHTGLLLCSVLAQGAEFGDIVEY